MHMFSDNKKESDKKKDIVKKKYETFIHIYSNYITTSFLLPWFG